METGGTWYFDYVEGEQDDEIGFKLGEERFVTGEYVSIGRAGKMHTYQVSRVEKPRVVCPARHAAALALPGLIAKVRVTVA